MTTPIRVMQTAFPTNEIYLIIGNIREFDYSNFNHWAEEFGLMTEVIHGDKKPETADVNTTEVSTSGAIDLERVAGVETTFIAAQWDKPRPVYFANQIAGIDRWRRVARHAGIDG